MRPFAELLWSVRLSVCPVDILTVTHQGAACEATSVHFDPTVRRTDVFADEQVSALADALCRF